MKRCHTCCGFYMCAHTEDDFVNYYDGGPCEVYVGTRDRGVLEERRRIYEELCAKGRGCAGLRKQGN